MYDSSKPYKKQILKLIQTTWDTPYLKIQPLIYPIFEKKFSFPEVDHTDGLGTKGFYHWQRRSFKFAVQDALAMNLNDLALVGATPYKLQNHLTLTQDDHEAILEIVRRLVEQCQKWKIAITGGETSIQNTIQGMDLSLTVSGFVENPKPNHFHPGDVLVGLKSNGLHANGFTKIREIFGDEVKEEFISPTPIYLDTIIRLQKKYGIRGLMHITGGAYTKLKDLLTDADLEINQPPRLKPQQIFQEIYELGLKLLTQRVC